MTLTDEQSRRLAVIQAAARSAKLSADDHELVRQSIEFIAKELERLNEDPSG